MRVEHICHAHIPQNKTSTTYVNNVLKEKNHLTGTYCSNCKGKLIEI